MSTASPFQLWNTRREAGYCVVRQPTGVRNADDIDAGLSRAQGWPDGVTCQMSDQFPDRRLPDCFFGGTLTIVSAAVHAALVQHGGPQVEYLPVRIADHDGREVARDCVIVNPLAIVDAIDLEASKVSWNAIQDDLIDSCKQLVIDPARVPAALQLFRLRHLEFMVVVRAELAARLVASGAVGFAPQDPAEYRGV